ncbi:uncharacterized protein LOC118421343 isoform X2 [Branchiostoma floridae]|uniref:Uncharacterized protein LOC118421343 isoform X2 n=1 Tax=Branchiostoma floridae TaxID=7739 RepID=A0A9J7LL02_BRAFL|nr:uncharacterized protein LOC118421343 isoform X2 [Branchiostoma floridae]
MTMKGQSKEPLQVTTIKLCATWKPRVSVSSSGIPPSNAKNKMANVFTRRSCLPRNITFTDYGPVNTQPRYIPRKLSPTRLHNPHPVGLVYQSPYNRDNHTFGIWEPDLSLCRSRFPDMFRHLGLTNFSTERNHQFSVPKFEKVPRMGLPPIATKITLQSRPPSRVASRTGATSPKKCPKTPTPKSPTKPPPPSAKASTENTTQ